jgi:hypothetical protein
LDEGACVVRGGEVGFGLVEAGEGFVAAPLEGYDGGEGQPVAGRGGAVVAAVDGLAHELFGVGEPGVLTGRDTSRVQISGDGGHGSRTRLS